MAPAEAGQAAAREAALPDPAVREVPEARPVPADPIKAPPARVLLPLILMRRSRRRYPSICAETISEGKPPSKSFRKCAIWDILTQ